MSAIQVRDVPQHIYRLLVEQASSERRSLAQQVVTVLVRGLAVEVDAKRRRGALLRSLRASEYAAAGRLSDAAKLIRADRRR